MKSPSELKAIALATVQTSFNGWHRTKPDGDIKKFLENLADFLVADMTETLARVQWEAHEVGFIEASNINSMNSTETAQLAEQLRVEITKATEKALAASKKREEILRDYIGYLLGDKWANSGDSPRQRCKNLENGNDWHTVGSFLKEALKKADEVK